jgi:hypothetical protein
MVSFHSRGGSETVDSCMRGRSQRQGETENDDGDDNNPEKRTKHKKPPHKNQSRVLHDPYGHFLPRDQPDQELLSAVPANLTAFIVKVWG